MSADGRCIGVPLQVSIAVLAAMKVIAAYEIPANSNGEPIDRHARLRPGLCGMGFPMIMKMP